MEDTTPATEKKGSVFMLMMTPTMRELIRKRAAQEHTSASAIIRRAIARYVVDGGSDQ